jgi:hypothetical protein
MDLVLAPSLPPTFHRVDLVPLDVRAPGPRASDAGRDAPNVRRAAPHAPSPP